MGRYDNSEILAHHGIQGQKWGIRRFQNPDGTLTPEGRKRYGKSIERGNKLISEGKTVEGEATKKVVRQAGIKAANFMATLGLSTIVLANAMTMNPATVYAAAALIDGGFYGATGYNIVKGVKNIKSIKNAKAIKQ